MFKPPPQLRTHLAPIFSSIPTRSTFLLPIQPFSPKTSALKFEHPPSFFPPTRSTQISPRATSSTPISLPNPGHNRSLFPDHPVHTHRLDLLPLHSPSPPPPPPPRPQSLQYCPTHCNPSVSHHAHILSPANASSSLPGTPLHDLPQHLSPLSRQCYQHQRPSLLHCSPLPSLCVCVCLFAIVQEGKNK